MGTGIAHVDALGPLSERERWGAACADVAAAIGELVASGEIDRQRREDVTDETPTDDGEDADHPAAVHLELATRYLALPADADEAHTIERAIAALERAQALARDGGDRLEARIALHLGVAYSRRLAGDRSRALARSIEELEHARSLLPAGDDRAAAASNLALALLEHVTPTRAQDVERAIELLQDAGRTWSALGIRGRWAGAQHNLGVAYGQRVTGDRFENQEDAIAAYRRALTVEPRGGGTAARTLVEWAATLNNLASALINRGQRRTAEDLERAIALLRISLIVRTADAFPVDWAMTQHNLGVAFSDRETGFGPANAKRAIGHLEAARQVRRRDARTADWVDTTLVLGAVLAQRPGGDMTDDRRRAVALYETALQSVDAAAAPLAFAALKTNLANVMIRQFEAGERPAIDAAEHAYADALDVYRQQRALGRARQAARGLGTARALAGRWLGAADAYEVACELDAALQRESILAAHQQAEIAEASGLYPQAAVALARAGRPERGLEVVEAGRARLLGDALARDRAELAELEPVAAGLSRDFREAAAALRQAVADERALAEASPQASERKRTATASRDAWERMERAVAAIRALPGFEQFLGSPTAAQIAAAVPIQLAIAYVVTGRFGTVVLVTGAGLADVDAIDLPALTDAQLERLLVVADGETVVGGFLAGLLGTGEVAEGVLHEAVGRALRELGEALMGPLAAILRARGATGAVLVAVGRVSGLPLHSCEVPATGGVFCDEFEVSYAPSARVLIAARRDDGLPSRREAFLGVAVDDAADDPGPLRFARLEVAGAAARFDVATTRLGSAAVRAGVLEDLSQVRFAHLACHGSFDFDEPLRSALVLHDGARLTMADLSSGRPCAGVRLVVAAACESAVVHPGPLRDEAIGLPSALLQAGARAVVGTLWPVDGVSSTLLVSKLWQLVCADPGRRPAVALAAAQRWLREADRAELVSFARELSDIEPGGTRALERLLGDEELQRPFEHEPLDWAGYVLIGV